MSPVAPSGSSFYAHPLWTRFAKCELEGPNGEAIQVQRGDAEKLQGILNAPEQVAALPTPSFRRYEVFQQDGSEWPGLVLRTTPTVTSVIARVSTVALANRLADPLNRYDAEDGRKSKSVNYWNRGI
jgi:hypothetical protein